MDIEVEQSITLWIGTCEIMQIVIDKMFFAKALLQQLYGWGVAFLQSYHCDWRTIKSLQVYQSVEFF